MTSSLLRAALAAATLGTSLLAQTFSYNDFSSTAQLNLLGSAAQSGASLRLTANASNQTGWVWRQGALPVVAGFDTTFTFRITPPTVGTKAEGMALVIHDDPNGASATGGTVWGMGYGIGANNATGIRNSIAIEFDTYMDTAPIADTSANELTIHTRGALGNHEYEQYSIARTTPAQNLANGQVHSLRVRYVPGTIEVFVDGATTPAISRAYDLVTGGLYLNGGAAPGANMANGSAFVGFCATTGAGSLTELVEILSWTWASTPPLPPCYAGTIAEDLLRIEGSTGGVLRRVQVATHQPFVVDIGTANAAAPGMPYLLMASFAPVPGAPGSSFPFGDLCFPVLPATANEVFVADGFDIVPSLFPAPAAPYTLQVPLGFVPFQVAMTVQAITVASLNPLTLGVTNAIDLRVVAAPAPQITSVSPLSAVAGANVNVLGLGFVPGVVVEVAGNPVVPSSTSKTQLSFPYPAGTPCGSQVVVRNPDGQTAQAAFNPVPVVTGTLLGSGTSAGNQFFVIQGSGFSAGSTVTIGGAAATVVSATSTSVTVRTPAGTPGVAPVVIATPGGCSANTSYTYL